MRYTKLTHYFFMLMKSKYAGIHIITLNSEKCMRNTVALVPETWGHH